MALAAAGAGATQDEAALASCHRGEVGNANSRGATVSAHGRYVAFLSAASNLSSLDEKLVAQVAPQLLAEPGFGPLTAGKLIGEIAGAQRFSSDAKLARAGGLAPIPVSSGKTNRHRLDRGGNRQINTAIHRVAVTRARCHPETRAYIARKRAEGKTNRDAIRCLKRHLARRVWHLLQPPTPTNEASRHQNS